VYPKSRQEKSTKNRTDTCDRINRKGFAAMADGSVWPSSRRSHDATSSIDLISHF